MTEEKTRIHTRISPETEQKIAAAMPFSNCRSQNEFVEKALQFYCEHLTAQDTFSALPPVLLSAIRATVQASEDRICRLLFKLAVEMDMMMNILAAGMELTDEDLRELRGRCVREVKETRGRISFEDAVDYQKVRTEMPPSKQDGGVCVSAIQKIRGCDCWHNGACEILRVPGQDAVGLIPLCHRVHHSILEVLHLP